MMFNYFDAWGRLPGFTAADTQPAGGRDNPVITGTSPASGREMPSAAMGETGLEGYSPALWLPGVRRGSCRVRA